MEKQLATKRGAQLRAEAGRLVETTRDVAGVRVLSHDAGEGVAAGDLRTLVQDLRSRLGEDAPVVVAVAGHAEGRANLVIATNATARERGLGAGDRKSTRLNSSHVAISYAVFCLKNNN